MMSRDSASSCSLCSTASSPLLLAPPPPAAVQMPVQMPVQRRQSAADLRESLRRDICGGGGGGGVAATTCRVWVAMMDEWGTPLGMQRVTLSLAGKIVHREPAIMYSNFWAQQPPL